MSDLRTSLYLLFILVMLSCKNSDYNPDSVLHTANNTKIEAIEIDEGSSVPGRAIWQKPGLVINKMGDITDKVIADIGAGTGYFSLKLAFKAKKVIAVEIDQEMLNFIDSTKLKLPTEFGNKIETRLALPNDPKLENNEVDIILLINTIAYIKDLPEYLQNLKKSLKPGGKLMIIDYKMKRLPINAPPKTERIYLDVVEDYLLNSGYSVLDTDDTSLDYQYIVEAKKD